MQVVLRLRVNIMAMMMGTIVAMAGRSMRMGRRDGVSVPARRCQLSPPMVMLDRLRQGGSWRSLGVVIEGTVVWGGLLVVMVAGRRLLVTMMGGG
jgi:hypothetical protein